MKTQAKTQLVPLLILSIFCMASSLAPNALAMPEIHGIYGLESTGDGAFLAIRINIPDGTALNSILWYNNDGSVIYPTVRVGTGYAHSPGLIDDFLVIAENVQGVTSGWSEVVFSEPIAASIRSLYLVFEFPMDQVLTNEGEDGGPGIGYLGSNEGCSGWLSGEGEIWARLHEDYAFAVQPELIPYEEGMAVKRFDGNAVEVHDLVVSNYFRASPNPFNPMTQFQFGLTKAGDVSVDIYDLRGRHVINVQNGFLSAGHHTVEWQGRDSAGRSVSSGVYFVRLLGEGFQLKQKILLVR